VVWCGFLFVLPWADRLSSSRDMGLTDRTLDHNGVPILDTGDVRGIELVFVDG